MLLQFVGSNGIKLTMLITATVNIDNSVCEMSDDSGEHRIASTVNNVKMIA